MAKGRIWMAPTTLGGEVVADVIPANVMTILNGVRHFIVEDVKSARRYLRRMNREFPIDESQFFELNKRTELSEISRFLKPIQEGFDIAVISEAGCPGIADPGAEVVAQAHLHDIRVSPLVGPSSILLALMGSGFSGQEFTFHGYLPKDRKDRIRKLKDYEGDARRTGYTHIFMDTPFRNMNVLDDLLNELADTTLLCIASDLTLLEENVRTMSVKDWREHAYDLKKKPTMFLIGAYK